MKLIALAAAAAGLVFTASVGARASTASHASAVGGASHFSLLLKIPSGHGVLLRRVVVPMQAVPTATPQATAQASPTAAPSPTQSPYPDPLNILNNSFTVLERITQVHWEYIITGDQTSVEHLGVDAKGTANCTSELGKVKGTDALLGTSQKSTVHFEFVQKGKKYFKKSLSGSNKTWKTAKAKDVAPFGFSLDNPLVCPSSSSTGGSGGTTLSSLVNQGSATYHGVKTWHLTATGTTTDSQGNELDVQYDFYISQDHFLMYGYKVGITVPSQDITESFEQVLTQFGKKVSIPTPKPGATTP